MTAQELTSIKLEDVCNAAEDAGESLHDADGEYVGVTFPRLVELLNELGDHRQAQKRLNDWMNENLHLNAASHAALRVPEAGSIDRAIFVLNEVKTVMQAAWPHLETVLTNVVQVMAYAGIVKPSTWKDKP